MPCVAGLRAGERYSLREHRRKGVTEMKLLTDELRKQLPPLYTSENDDDPMVICKFFYPDFSWTWYAIEFDGVDDFFGEWSPEMRTKLGLFPALRAAEQPGKVGLSDRARPLL